MRLIDADEFRKTMFAEIERLYRVGHPYSATVVSDVIEKLDLEPSVDAEPIVHCKDCKFRSETQSKNG